MDTRFPVSYKIFITVDYNPNSLNHDFEHSKVAQEQSSEDLRTIILTVFEGQ